MTNPRSALRTLLALVVLLVIAFGCEQTPPEHRLGTFYPVSASISTVTFATPLVLSAGHRRMVWAGATPAVLAKALSGHTAGGRLTVEFPANTATALYLAPELNCRGDFSVDAITNAILAWDATKAHIAEIEQGQLYSECAIVTLAAPDVTAPTVTGVTAAAANPNAIVVGFSEPVFIASADVGTAFTAPCTSGTTRTLTAIEAGNGTNSVTFTTSGNYVGTEVCKFVVGSGRVSTDYSGNLVATNGLGTSVTFLFGSGLANTAAWTRAYDYLQGVAGTGTGFTWTDIVSGSVQLTPKRTSGPTVVSGVPTFAGDIEQRIDHTDVLTTGTDFACFAEFNNPAAADGGYALAFDHNGPSVDQWVYINNYFQAEALGDVYSGAGAVVHPTGITGGAAYHRYYLSRSGSTLKLSIDGAAAVTATNSTSSTGLVAMAIGGTLYNNALFPSGKAFTGGIKRAAFIANRDFTGTEIADTDAWAVAHP